MNPLAEGLWCTVCEFFEDPDSLKDSEVCDGCGHSTSQSEELQQVGDDLETWADEIEAVEFPEQPEPVEEDCPECGGTGEDVHLAPCEECNGSGQSTPEEPTEDQMEEWLDEARGALEEQTGACPV